MERAIFFFYFGVCCFLYLISLAKIRFGGGGGVGYFFLTSPKQKDKGV